MRRMINDGNVDDHHDDDNVVKNNRNYGTSVPGALYDD